VGPAGRDGRRASGRRRRQVGPNGQTQNERAVLRERREWEEGEGAMRTEWAAALDVSEGRWAAAGSGHPWGKREVGSRAGRGERAQGRRPR